MGYLYFGVISLLINIAVRDTVELKYDDGTWESRHSLQGGNRIAWAMRMTPESYPFVLTGVKYWIFDNDVANGSDTIVTPFKAAILDDGGGAPGVNELIDPILVDWANHNTWTYVPTPYITIDSGDFYVCMEFVATIFDPMLGGDDNYTDGGGYDNRDYEGNIGTTVWWQGAHHTDFLMRAQGVYENGVHENIVLVEPLKVISIAPNPFDKTVTVKYEVISSEEVKISIYDIIGRAVKTLIDKRTMPGKHTAVWDGRNSAGRLLKEGVYFVTLKIGSLVKMEKIILLRQIG